MPREILTQNDGIESVEECPWRSYYTSAVDAILDTSLEECDLLARRAEETIVELKEQRLKLIGIIDRFSSIAHKHGLKRITFTPNDNVGVIVDEMNALINDILGVFAGPTPSIDQLNGALPSNTRKADTKAMLENAERILHNIDGRLSYILIEMPARVEKVAEELRFFRRLDQASHFLECKQRLEAIHYELASREVNDELSLSQVLSLTGNESFDALKSSLAAAEKEIKQIRGEELRIRKQNELEEQASLAEEAKLELERRTNEEAAEAEKKHILSLQRPIFYILPLTTLALLIIILDVLSERAAFGVSMATLFFSIASGLSGVILVARAIQQKREAPKFFLDNEVLVAFSILLPVAFVVLQFLSAILTGIVVFIFNTEPSRLTQAVSPYASWRQFFGFIILGPLALLTSCTATIAVYYLSLIKLKPYRMEK